VRAFLALLVWVFAFPVLAAEPGASDWFETDQGRVRLVAATPGELGLEFDMAPGWKIYWRAPGDAGYPPAIDWRGSENLAGTEILWPAPHRFSIFGIDTIGYEGKVVLPIAAQPADAAAPLRLRASVDFLTCREICIPYQAEFVLDEASPSWSNLLAEWRARVPGNEGALRIVSARVRGGRPAMLEIAVAGKLASPDAFVEAPEGFLFGKPSFEGGVLRLPVDASAPERLVGQPITVTLVDGTESAAATLVATAGPPLGAFSALLPILAIALLGGLILNAMPCVLPVLSLKLLGMTGGARALLATALGIIASFAVLGAAMIGLKAAGVAVGWGVQFQQPLFLAAMMGIVVLFAANLWGVFEVPMPAWADRVAGGRAGAFATGAFATLLATPCSAPFLGTAIGFALAAGPLEIGAVFLALGLGMALPYLVVAAIPGAVRLMPRPGPWMVTVKRVLALLLVATAVWLASVLAAQVGAAIAAAVAGILAASTLLLHGGARAPNRRRVALALVIAAAAVAATAPPRSGGGVQAAAGWRGFDRAAIERLVSDGKVVFVDVTADWCLTCQVNKKLVLDTDAVRARFAAPEIVPMRADWTRPDPAINDYLRSFGRYGIPFNAVYGPGAPQGLALPELLTTEAVLEALKRAEGERKPAASERAIAAAKVPQSTTKGEKP
jgi:suppressor for copper-sensitivity B